MAAPVDEGRQTRRLMLLARRSGPSAGVLGKSTTGTAEHDRISPHNCSDIAGVPAEGVLAVARTFSPAPRRQSRAGRVSAGAWTARRRAGGASRSAASRHTGACSTCMRRARAGGARLAGPGRALDSTRLRVLGIDYLGGSGESSGPTAGGEFPSLSSYDQAEALRGLLDHLRIERLRAHRRRLLWRHGGAGLRRALSRARRAAAGHQCRRPPASDVHRLAQRAAAHRALCALGGTRGAGTAAGAGAGHGDLPQSAGVCRALCAAAAPTARTASYSRSRIICSRAGATTRRAIGRNPSCACPNRSICTRWTPRASGAHDPGGGARGSAGAAG